MSPEMKDLLTKRLDEATTPDEMDKALVESMKALVDCQCKTAERVKEMREGAREEALAKKNKIEGVSWLWGVLAAFAASGGGATILKLLEHWKP
jgi:hypothetical protein